MNGDGNTSSTPSSQEGFLGQIRPIERMGAVTAPVIMGAASYLSQCQGGIPPADDSTGNATCSGW
jgi:hypothetical protein